MQIARLLNEIEAFAPLGLALDWDNVGLLVGNRNRDAKRVLISLDLSPNTLEHAIQTGADLILTHHPVWLRGTKSIIDPMMLRLIEHKIALISLHTNFDVAEHSVNHALAEALGLIPVQHLSSETGLGSGTEDSPYGLGLICKSAEDFSLGELAKLTKEKLGIPTLRYYLAGKTDADKVPRIALCGGAGASMIKLAETSADVLITGDIGYHYLLESGIPIIDAGHFYTEYPSLQILLAKMLELGLEASVLPIDQHEFVINNRFV